MLNIAFICDENFILPTSVAVTSLIHNNKAEKMTIHIITPGVSESAKLKLKEMETENAEIRVYDVENSFLDISTSGLFDGIPANHTALMKFNLPHILNDVDKLLYLDGDLIVNGDITQFYSIELGDNIVAAVYDSIADWHMKELGVTEYFNSGVMLLNLRKMRDEGLSNRLVDYRCKGFNRFMDQDAFNAVFKDRVIFAEFKYNTMYSILETKTPEQIRALYNISDTSDIGELVEKSVILHFSSSKKPWKYILPGLCLIYRKYVELSPYAGYEFPYIGETKPLFDAERFLEYYKNDNPVLISIVIPAHNVEASIKECMDSVTNQTLRDIEIIVVNDASSDSTSSILDGYAANDSRIKVINCEENVGTCMARKLGVQSSIGQFIMFVDGDDKIKLNACEELYRAMIINDADIIQFKTEIVANDSNSATVSDFDKYINKSYGFLTSDELINKSFVKKELSRNLWNRIYKGKLVRESLRDLDEGYYLKSEDLYTSLLIAFSAKNIKFVDASYYIYSMGIGITSNTSQIGVSKYKNICTGIDVVYCIAEFIKNKHNDEKYLPLMTTMFSHCFTESNWWIQYVSPENFDECLDICYEKYRKLLVYTDDALISKALASSIDQMYFTVKKGHTAVIRKIEAFMSGIENNIEVFNRYSHLFHNYFMNENKAVNIAVNITNRDFNYLVVLLESIYQNRRNDKLYNIYVFGNGLYNKYLDRMGKYETENMSVRFVTKCGDVSSNIQKGMDGNLAYKMYAMYFLEYLDRIIYMTYDSVVIGDISELMRLPLEDKSIAVAREYSPKTGEATEQFSNNIFVIDRISFKKMNLKERYFNDGAKMSEKQFLNAVFNANVIYLKDNWCFQWHIPYKCLNGKISTDYDIIHWGSDDKPWRSPHHAYAEVFWRYARSTSFYEEIIYENIRTSKANNESTQINVSVPKRTLWYRFKIGCRDIGFFATIKKAAKKAFKKVFRKRG